MYDNGCKSKILTFFFKEKTILAVPPAEIVFPLKTTPVTGASCVSEVLALGQLMGDPVVTSL